MCKCVVGVQFNPCPKTCPINYQMLGGNESYSIIIPPGTAIPDSSQESHLTSNYLIFEIPPSFADNLSDLTLRGDDNVVLCNNTSTCTIRQAETSNLMLFIQESPADPSAVPICNAYESQHDTSPTSVWKLVDDGSCYFEALETKPTPELLAELLKASLYRGEADDVNTTMEFLLDTIPASEAEIVGFLKSLKAVCLDGDLISHRYIAN
jgi:Sister chromatid cohesion protein Dcc1